MTTEIEGRNPSPTHPRTGEPETLTDASHRLLDAMEPHERGWVIGYLARIEVTATRRGEQRERDRMKAYFRSDYVQPLPGGTRDWRAGYRDALDAALKDLADFESHLPAEGSPDPVPDPAAQP